jgi:SAM-dependent methyltransferase
MREWIDFYDSNHTIYANARHMDVHFRRIAEDIASYVADPAMVVLDYGCGEALHADVVAAKTARLILVEPAPGVRARLEERFAGNPRIKVCAPDDTNIMPDQSIDIIVMHSVSQYLTAEELIAALRRIRRLIKPTGKFILGDVIPPRVAALTDAIALLRFGWKEGFFIPAVGSLFRTVFSNYRRLRSSLGLSRYDEDTMIAKLTVWGFAAARQPGNIGHNAARMTFVSRPNLPKNETKKVTIV